MPIFKEQLFVVSFKASCLFEDSILFENNYLQIEKSVNIININGQEYVETVLTYI